MLKKLLRKCPVCSNNTGQILHDQHFVLPENNQLPSSYNIVSCNSCGFVFADMKANQKIYDNYYAQMAKYDTAINTSDISRYTETASIINGLMPDKKTQILDIGSGSGGLLLSLKKHGFKNLTALDPSDKAIKKIKKQGIMGFCGNILNNQLNQKYDLVILTGVLEHIYDVCMAMRAVIKLSAKNGLIFIEVPYAGRYANYPIKKEPFHYFNTEHINHFEETSLHNLAAINKIEKLKIIKGDVAVSSLVKYPDIIFICKNSRGNLKKVSGKAKENVLKYISLSKKSMPYEKKIKILKREKSLAIYGAGNFTQRILANTSLADAKITCFIDGDPNKQGKKLGGIRIYGPDQIAKLPLETPIVISSAVYADEICEKLIKMKIKNKIVLLN